MFVSAADEAALPAASMADEHFSVILDAGPGGGIHGEGLLHAGFLAPDLVRPHLRIRGRFVVMEGARRVAVATVIDLLEIVTDPTTGA